MSEIPATSMPETEVAYGGLCGREVVDGEEEHAGEASD